MPWQEIIGILGTVVMGGLGILGWARNHRGDASGDGRNSGIVVTKLETLQNGIDEIKGRLAQRDREYVDVIARLTSLESTLGQLVNNTMQDMMRRLERLENKCRRFEDGA